MDYHTAFQISASGMATEKLRLDAAAANLANMHNAAPTAADAYRPVQVVSRAAASFGSQFGQLQAAAGVQGALVPQSVAPRMVYEPGHPYADPKGFVSYPGVDHTTEMLNVNLALRTYDANVAAMSAAKTMAMRALEIGGQK